MDGPMKGVDDPAGHAASDNAFAPFDPRALGCDAFAPYAPPASSPAASKLDGGSAKSWSIKRKAPPRTAVPASAARAAAPLPVVVSGCRRPGGSAALVARA